VTPDELRDRILRWEDPHTDFKESVDSNSELAKDLVCFANSDGGQLVIGVAKDRSVVGVPDTNQLLLRVDDIAFQNCSPSLSVVPEVIKLDGKDVVVLNIPKGDQRPYSLETVVTMFDRERDAVGLAGRAAEAFPSGAFAVLQRTTAPATRTGRPGP
jgi:predicted HTH transcriptional regulator